MSRVLKRLEVLITNDYAHHNGWSKGTDVVGKLENGKTTIDDVIAHTEGKVIKVVKEIAGLSLGDAKALVDGAPKAIKEGISKEEAESIKASLEEAGAEVELK